MRCSSCFARTKRCTSWTTRLVARDMGWMYAQGAHPYILAQVALTRGFDMQEYQRQVRAAAGYEGETDG